MSSSVSRGLWSNFTNRSKSLALKNKSLQKALLSPELPSGPVSLKARSNKSKYASPSGLDKIYPLAYNFLESESEKSYKKITEIESKITEISDETEKVTLSKEVEDLKIKAELDNPEVVYNSLFYTNSLDREQPVYRHYLKEQWKSYSRMLTMQRLESLSVIPDTLPTLEPEIEVKLRFPNSNVDTWIEPGRVLSSNVTSKPPALEIIEFRESKNDLYTVLIINPDTPDLTNDSFSTTLQWGLKDVELSNTDSIIDAKKIVSHPEYEFSEYLPSVPEKNTGNQRYALWVFRQSGKLENAPKDISKENFDIRKFVELNNLTPIGAHVWRSTWDLNTDKVREMYGLPAGRVFSRERI